MVVMALKQSQLYCSGCLLQVQECRHNLLVSHTSYPYDLA